MDKNQNDENEISGPIAGDAGWLLADGVGAAELDHCNADQARGEGQG